MHYDVMSRQSHTPKTEQKLDLVETYVRILRSFYRETTYYVLSCFFFPIGITQHLAQQPADNGR